MRLKNSCALILLSFATLLLSSCGGSSSAGSSPTPLPVTPDFTIAASPNSLNVAQSSSLNFSVTVTPSNNFNAPVSLTLSGLPSNIVPSLKGFSLTPGNSQIITLNAAALATVQSLTFTITGTSGTLTHTAQLPLTVSAAQPAFRMRYFDTRQTLPGSIMQHSPYYAPSTFYNAQPVVLYHTPTKRFFFANTSQNQILVYDAATESQTTILSLPTPWSIDQTTDQSLLYVGTLVGDIYVVDPVALTVKRRIPANTIGSNGFTANAAIPLADGNLALLGSVPPNPLTDSSVSIESYTSLGIWNQSTNSLTLYTTSYWSSFTVPGQVVCPGLETFAYLLPTPSRTNLILGDGSVICELNPANGQAVSSSLSNARSTRVVQTPDGTAIINFSLPTVTVFNPATLQVVDQFDVQWNGNSPYQNFLLSNDGNTLYLIGGLEGYAAAYNWKTHAFLGWASTPSKTGSLTESYPDFQPYAIDPSGLMAGILGHGIGFADMNFLQTGSFDSYYASPKLTPAVGSTTGGANVQIAQPPFLNDPLLDILFGASPSPNPTISSSEMTASTPAHPAGPVDLLVRSAAGGLALAANAFSYGPSIDNVIANFSPADGGGTGTAFGYGLLAGSSAAVSVGGTPATITASTAGFTYFDGDTIPLQSIQFTIPPGTPNSSANIQISNSAGVTSQAAALTYLPATRQFPLSGAQLYQGIYDPHRNVYYFTDQNKIQLFSRPQAAWLSPISIPVPAGATSQRLTGISLSPNGSYLAIADSAARVVYVLNPSTPSSVLSFPLPSSVVNPSPIPCALAVSDQGIVYITTTTTNSDGPAYLSKLVVSSGTITTYDTLLGGDANQFQMRPLITPDNKSVFVENGAELVKIDTSTDSIEFANGQYVPTSPLIFDLALSPDGASLIGGLWLFDSSTLRVYSPIQINEQWSLGQSTLYSSKFSADSKLIFRPEPNAIDVIRVSTGLPFARIALPFALNTNFDALVSDGADNILIAITGSTGTGIAIIDLSSLPENLKMAPVQEPKPRDTYFPARTAHGSPSRLRTVN